MTLTSHILQRSLHAAQNMHAAMGDDAKEPQAVSPLAVVVFVITIAIFAFIFFSISYTYGHIIPALCMVESPEADAYVPIETNDPPAYTATAPSPKPTTPGVPEDLEPNAVEEVLLVRTKPITSSLRQTVQHLRAKAGFLSRYRGLSMFIVWHMGVGFLVQFISLGMKIVPVVILARVIAETLMATVHMGWVHVVISEPSEKRWYQRIPSIRTWPKIAPAVAIWAVTEQLVMILPLLVTGTFGSLKHMKDTAYEPDQKDLYAIGAQGLFAMVLTVALFVLLQIPSTVTLVRVAASMLPEEDETIVPFDRTFGGKTTPAIVGGQGKIGLVEAWRSFPWASRMRLVRLMAKVALFVLAIWMLFTSVLIVEAHILFGDKIGDVLRTGHFIAHGHN